MNEGLVSVVMAVYNGESYVAKAIESILQQTYSNFEFIIVNDGSHAVVAKLLEEMADRDARIRLVVNESNIGLTKSLNRGLKIARGKFIARMDADDWSHPERLAQQIAFLQSNPKVKVVGTDVVIVDDEGKERHKVALSNFNTMRRIFRRNCLVHGSLMYDRETLQEIGGYDEEFRLAQDYDLSLRIAERFMIACLDRCLYFLRESKDNISTKKFFTQLYFTALAKYKHVLRTKNYSSGSFMSKIIWFGELVYVYGYIGKCGLPKLVKRLKR